MNIEKILKESNYARTEIKPNPKFEALTRWQNKKIEDAITIFDGKNANYVSTNIPYKMMPDGLLMKASTSCFGQSPRPYVSFVLNLKNLRLTSYNRIRASLNIKAIGHRNFYVHLSLNNTIDLFSDQVVINPNKDEDILWELSHINLDKVSFISLTIFLMGTPDEAEDDIEILIKKINLEKVELDYDYGWEANSISYSHIGYLPNSKKTAFISNVKNNDFSLFDEHHQLILNGELKEINNNLGHFKMADFSKIKEPGNYYLKIGKFKTNLFPIDKNIFVLPSLYSLNFLRMLRCGEQIDGVHFECHSNCKAVNSENEMVPVFGGWHDAGDVSQFEICTAEMTSSLLEILDGFKNDKLMYERIKEEARVGTNWLLRTRFKNGERALAILYNVWRQSETSLKDETIISSHAENSPFENFLASSALSKSSLIFLEDKIYQDWCLKIAKLDFEEGLIGLKKGYYSKRWGPSITVIVKAELIKAAVNLYYATKDEKYLKVAEEHVEDVCLCQETFGVGSEKLRGFFYEDIEHRYVLSYEHRGHEQNPIEALTKFIKAKPDSIYKELIMDTIGLYKEFILKTVDYTYPYHLIPNHIYNINKINLNRFTLPSSKPKEFYKDYLIESIKEGIKIDQDWYLRIFPIAYDRTGFHATMLSKVKAISSIYKLDQDVKLKQIVLNQLEWIFGKNPFSTSTMYGIGYNYHPLYVAFSNQIVGALPVGIKTLGHKDIPYWPQATGAVYKEIWGHTTSKLLMILADII